MKARSRQRMKRRQRFRLRCIPPRQVMALYAAIFPGLPGEQTKLKNLIDGMPLPALTASEENANK